MTNPGKHQTSTNASDPPRTEGIVAGAGMVLGLALIVSSRAFPPGVGALPGPGFFPLILGFLIAVFAGMIAVGARSRRSNAVANPIQTYSWKLPSLALLAVTAYVAAWEAVPFLVRTPVLVLALMKAAGASWRNSLIAALLISGFLYLAFQLGLRVTLD